MTTDLTDYGLQPIGSGTIDGVSGTFTQGEGPAASANLNPFVDSDPWGVIMIGGLQLPGIITSIDGHEKPEEWSVQKGTGSSGATISWKGTKLAEAVKIVGTMVDAGDFDRYYLMRDTLRPKLGTKPPSLMVVNPAINCVGITRIACVNVGPPKPAEGLAWTYEVTVCEYNPTKPAAVGPAGNAHPPADKRELPPEGCDENGNRVNPGQTAEEAELAAARASM